MNHTGILRNRYRIISQQDLAKKKDKIQKKYELCVYTGKGNYITNR